MKINLVSKIKKRKEKGITLVALVVTIVILLILAGVSINLVLNENGLVIRAIEARDKTAQSTENDLMSLNNLYDEMVGLIEDSNQGDSNVGETTPPDNTETEEPTISVTSPYLPSKAFSYLENTDLDTGLVITDGTNEYVWIEVPKTTAVYPTAGINLDLDNLTGTDLTTAYTKIENDLHTYSTVYRNGTSYSDTYYADDSDYKADWFANKTEYNTAKNKMLKSVYEHGGFYIGRYEAGISTNRTAKGDATTTPVSQANAYPYTYVTRTQAKVLAEQVSDGSYTSSLMFGVQWDLVLKYIEEKEVETNGESSRTTIQTSLQSDSTSWGNYYDSAFTINRGKYAQYNYTSSTWTSYPNILSKLVVNGVKYAQSSYSNAVLCTTGASDRNKKQNIYDLAGNVWEWTLEYTSNTDRPCALRGGNIYDSGSNYPASSRYYDGTSNAYADGGFRVALY